MTMTTTTSVTTTPSASTLGPSLGSFGRYGAMALAVLLSPVAMISAREVAPFVANEAPFDADEALFTDEALLVVNESVPLESHAKHLKRKKRLADAKRKAAMAKARLLVADEALSPKPKSKADVGMLHRPSSLKKKKDEVSMNGVERILSDGAFCSQGYVDCVDGFVRGSDGAVTCEEECDGDCCIYNGDHTLGYYVPGSGPDGSACVGFTGMICRDGSCDGSNACRMASIPHVVNSCLGREACHKAGGAGTGEPYCENDCGTSAVGNIGNVRDSCQGIRSCVGMGYAGSRDSGVATASVGYVYSSCLEEQACTYVGGVFTIGDYSPSSSSVGNLLDSCDAPRACQGLAKNVFSPETGFGDIIGSCNSIADYTYYGNYGGCERTAARLSSNLPAMKDSNLFECCNADGDDCLRAEEPADLPEECAVPPLPFCSSTNGDTEMEVSAPGTVTLTNYNCEEDIATVKKGIVSALEEVACDLVSCECTATVTDLKVLDCPNNRRGLKGADNNRKLQAVPSLVAEFIVTATTYLENTVNEEAETAADAVYGALSLSISSSLTDNSFVTALQAYSNLNDIIAAQGTAVISVSAIIAPLLALLSQWYPGWQRGISTCLNDGNAPRYMTLTGSFIRSSLEACCDSFFGWQKANCLIEGGADPAQYITNKYYVDYSTDSCKVSCITGTSGLNCGGLASSWQEEYDTAEDCCDKTLFWVDKEGCVARSTLTEIDAHVGTNQWYVDWKKYQCVKDCVESAANPDGQCGGLAERWEEPLYGSAATCCEQLHWVEKKDCVISP